MVRKTAPNGFNIIPEKEDNWGGFVPNPPVECPGRIVKGADGRRWVDVNWCNCCCKLEKHCATKALFHKNAKEARKNA